MTRNWIIITDDSAIQHLKGDDNENLLVMRGDLKGPPFLRALVGFPILGSGDVN